MKKILVILLVSLFMFPMNGFAHQGDLDKNLCHFVYDENGNKIEYHCHRNFKDPIFEKPNFKIFNGLSDLEKININEDILNYINKNNTCKGINILGDFDLKIEKDRQPELYNIREIEGEILRKYFDYLEKGGKYEEGVISIGQKPIESLKTDFYKAEKDYIVKKSKYENAKINWNSFIKNIDEYMGMSSQSAIGYEIERKKDELINGYYTKDFKYHSFKKEAEQSSLVYQRYLYGLDDLDKTYETFGSFLEDTCKSKYLELKAQEVKKIDEEIAKSEEKIRIEEEKMQKIIKEEEKKVSAKLQAKMDNIKKVLPVFYKKYPKKILSLLPVIKSMKTKFDKNSEKYLLLEFLEKEIEKLK